MAYIRVNGLMDFYNKVTAKPATTTTTTAPSTKDQAFSLAEKGLTLATKWVDGKQVKVIEPAPSGLGLSLPVIIGGGALLAVILFMRK